MWEQILGTLPDKQNSRLHASYSSEPLLWGEKSGPNPFTGDSQQTSSTMGTWCVWKSGAVLIMFTSVIVQGFNWESHRENWWQRLNQQAQRFSDLGFTLIWIPPPTASVAAQGYMPLDLYNLNSAYGSEEDLRRWPTTPSKTTGQVAIYIEFEGSRTHSVDAMMSSDSLCKYIWSRSQPLTEPCMFWVLLWAVAEQASGLLAYPETACIGLSPRLQSALPTVLSLFLRAILEEALRCLQVHKSNASRWPEGPLWRNPQS